MTARALLMLAVVTGSCAGMLGAQSVAGAAFVSLTEHRVDAGYGVERVSGPLGGASITLLIPPRVALRVATVGGSLTHDTEGAEDRDVGEVRIEACYRTLSWLTLEAGAATRTYTAPIAGQRWTMLQIGAEVRVPILDGRVDALGRFSLLPLVSVTGLEQPELALAASAGVEYHLGPVTAGLLYALERYDFPARDGIARLEQLTGLVARLSATVVRF